MKCVLLDDEMPGLTYLKMLCEQIPEVEVVKAYNDPQKFVNESGSLKFELCILDIEMPRLNGMQVATLLKDKLVIFATAYREYAADAFDLDAVDFVQKPVTKERLHAAIRKAIARRSSKEQRKQHIQLNSEQGKALIQVDHLAYITTSAVDSRDKVAVMLDNSSLVLKNISFGSLREQLPHDDFCRVNKKQLIALKIVASFTFDWITTTLLQDGKPLKIALSDAYRDQFQQAVEQIS